MSEFRDSPRKMYQDDETAWLVRAKPTACGRATLEGFADPARKDTLFLRESPVGRRKSVCTILRV